MTSTREKQIKVLDLFSGIGGFSLGFSKAGGFYTVAFVEIDEAARRVLRKHWPQTPIFSDIKSIDGESLGDVDMVCGGFPCQAFSTASAGKKVAENLWPEMRRIIQIYKPTWVVAENVLPAPITTAQDDLKSLGYQCEQRSISADECGADHKRNRWWLCAYSNNKSEFSSALNAEVAKLPKLCKGVWAAENYARAVRVSDGLPNRVDRLRLLGNTVIPQIPQAIGNAIKSVHT